MSSGSGTGGSDFHNSIYKLLNMTLACRPSNPVDFAAVFFEDEQHVQYELAHAIHQVRYFEGNKEKFREQVSAIFFSEIEKIEDALPSTDCLPLGSAIRVIKALYGENLNMLTVILEYFRPEQYLSFTEFEAIVEWTVICLNFSTYLKTFICDAVNKSLPSDAPASNTVTFQFLENAFRCLHVAAPTTNAAAGGGAEVLLLPNIAEEDISAAKWKQRAGSIIYALDYFQHAEVIKLDEFLNECVSHYFGFISAKRND